jgi:hypothetical protein
MGSGFRVSAKWGKGNPAKNNAKNSGSLRSEEVWSGAIV